METPSPSSVQQIPVLQQIHIATHHWLNDMSFFDDETRFLSSLLDKYFIFLLSHEHVNRIQLVNERLKQTGIVKSLIRADVLKHQKNLDTTLKNDIEQREDFLKLEHTRLEEELADLAKSFKSIKHEIFKITEEVMKSEKLNLLKD